jgi:hypothetical protein
MIDPLRLYRNFTSKFISMAVNSIPGLTPRWWADAAFVRDWLIMQAGGGEL